MFFWYSESALDCYCEFNSISIFLARDSAWNYHGRICACADSTPLETFGSGRTSCMLATRYPCLIRSMSVPHKDNIATDIACAALTLNTRGVDCRCDDTSIASLEQVFVGVLVTLMVITQQLFLSATLSDRSCKRRFLAR